MIIEQSRLEKFDEAYSEYNRSSIRYLVSELRKIRRVIQSGQTVRIEGTETVFSTFSDFYFWAHERYPSLEDDPKVEWIGMD